MRLNQIETDLAETKRQLADLEARWPKLDARTRARVRPRLNHLREQRARLIERVLRS